MVAIAKTSDFNFEKYLEGIQKGGRLIIIDTNNKDRANFILEGHRWPMIFQWEIDEFLVEAKGSVNIYEKDDHVHLRYSCNSSGEFEKNGKRMAIIAFLLCLIPPSWLMLTLPSVRLYMFFFIYSIVMFLSYSWSVYMVGKYSNMGIQRQNQALRYILHNNTIANHNKHWLDE